MKNSWIYTLLFSWALLIPATAIADDEASLDGVNTTENTLSRTSDTALVYNSWQAIFDQVPDTFMVRPVITERSPFDFSVRPGGKDKAFKKMLKSETVAIAFSDSTWLLNSDWVKAHFKGDCKHWSRYVPLYFSSKIAFVQFQRNRPTVGGALLNMLVDGLSGLDTGVGLGDGYNGKTPKLYVLDFNDHLVKEVDAELLVQLLSRYTDLQRRYESRNGKEKTEIINDFFLQYVTRIDHDPGVPALF